MGGKRIMQHFTCDSDPYLNIRSISTGISKNLVKRSKQCLWLRHYTVVMILSCNLDRHSRLLFPWK